MGNGADVSGCLYGGVAVGDGATARYGLGGVAVGKSANADYDGIAIGYQANGAGTNIAIGFQANAAGGHDRIAIGYRTTNLVDNSACVYGTVYLHGGTAVMYRSTTGTGAWQLKAFTIPHPLDPENKVLRHYCAESPDVWNIYAGNVCLVEGEAIVQLPDYYEDLNLVGSESYILAPIGAPATVYVKDKVLDNTFVIAADEDVKVSWTVKVKRNDPWCQADLLRRPAEQPVYE